MEEEGSTLKLIIEKGPRKGETLEFRPGSRIRIGRVVRGNTVAIKDAGISTKHLSIESQSGNWVITDLDSSNGTVLNSSQLLPLIPSDLADGDTIKLGEISSIKVKIEAHGCDFQLLRRNPRRRAAAEEKSESVLGLGNVENRRGQDRTRRARVVNVETEGSLCEDVKVEESENLGPVEPKQGRGVSTRRTRSSKNEENSSLVQNGFQTLETSAQVVDKLTRGGRRRKKKSLKEEPLKIVEIEDSKVKEDVKESNSNQEECNKAEENEALEDKEIGDRDGPDLEKMTLGEWFDYLEVYLPKQIYDETEEMILAMNQKAKQFHEFIANHKDDKEKGKQPMD